MAVLRIHTPVVGREERVFEWDGRPISLGRDEACDVVLLEQAASRHHARLEQIHDEIRLSDDGSANGTWVGSERVSTRVLSDGEIFRIGETTIQLVLDPFRQETLPGTPVPEVSAPQDRRALGSGPTLAASEVAALARQGSRDPPTTAEAAGTPRAAADAGVSTTPSTYSMGAAPTLFGERDPGAAEPDASASDEPPVYSMGEAATILGGPGADESAPYTMGDGGPVAARTNWSVAEAGHLVWYVGGSVFGRAEDAAGYADWPDPDGVPAEAPGDAWMSMAGDDWSGGDGIPDEWTDPFTHCVDPSDADGSQRPASWPRFISGRWGHNSNSDAEASWLQFVGCGQDPVVAAQDAWVGSFACVACGLPRVDEAGALVQQPCRDWTHTAASYWERSPGTHDVDDLDLGKFDAVGPARAPTDSWAALPKPVCRTSGQPVYGM
ncbi:MAG: FHA domain-containing protein [Myxococcales bacterium]|nr:FHA domain-containing protein [Myxococcales bacterium]